MDVEIRKHYPVEPELLKEDSKFEYKPENTPKKSKSQIDHAFSQESVANAKELLALIDKVVLQYMQKRKPFCHQHLINELSILIKLTAYRMSHNSYSMAARFLNIKRTTLRESLWKKGLVPRNTRNK